MPGAGHGDGHGYAHEPLRRLENDPPEVRERIREATNLRDEPEAISGAWVDAQAELAERDSRQRRLVAAAQARLDRERLSIENRMRDAERRAKLQHVDVTGEMFVMRKMLQRGKQASAEGRLERVEARLDGVLDDAA